MKHSKSQTDLVMLFLWFDQFNGDWMLEKLHLQIVGFIWSLWILDIEAKWGKVDVLMQTEGHICLEVTIFWSKTKICEIVISTQMVQCNDMPVGKSFSKDENLYQLFCGLKELHFSFSVSENYISQILSFSAFLESWLLGWDEWGEKKLSDAKTWRPEKSLP